MLNNLLAPTPAPLVVVATVIRNARVVDLTDGLVRRHVGVAEDELLIPTLNWKQLNRQGYSTKAQQLGDALRARADIDGLVVPSWFVAALPDAAEWPIARTRNLVLFMDPGSSARPRDRATIAPFDPDGLLP